MPLHSGIDQALAVQREDPDRADLLEFFVEVAETRRQFGTHEADQVLVLRHHWGDSDVEFRMKVNLGTDNAFLQFVPEEHLEALINEPVHWIVSIPADEVLNMAQMILDHLPPRKLPRVES